MNLKNAAPTLDSRLCGEGVDVENIAVGAVLRAWRERRKWTVSKVCSVLAISSPLLRDVEAGEINNDPAAHRVRRLAGLYIRENAAAALMAEALAVRGTLLTIPGPPGGFDASELTLIARAVARRNQRVMPTPGQTSYAIRFAAKPDTCESEYKD